MAAGWNDVTVAVPPSMTEAVPVVKVTALVLTTRIAVVIPGWIWSSGSGPKLNPTTIP
jgi:hypothetical protein